MRLYGVIIILMALASCAPGPKDIAYGEVNCDYCRMTVVDEQYAAEAVTKKGKVYYFDAIECMIHWIQQNKEEEFAHLLVNHYSDPGKLHPANESFYLISESLPSPMGAFLNAFGSRKSVLVQQEKSGGEIYDWEGLLANLDYLLNFIAMKHTIYSLLLLVAIALVSCGAPQDNSSPALEEPSQELKGQSAVEDNECAKNILQIAASSPDHTTLAAACVAAGLEDVLVNAGPLTVFAPTNAAFDALPEGTVESLLEEENLPTLARIIKYHAAPGSYDAGKLKDGQRLFMASGHYIKISVEGDKIMIGDATVQGTVQASNGLVHVIDKVLLPPDE